MTATVEFLKNMDKGFYSEARAKQMTPGAYLAQQVNPEEPEVTRTYTRLLKKLRGQDDGGFFAQQVYEYAREVTALGKCFEERDIRVKGAYVHPTERFFVAEKYVSGDQKGTTFASTNDSVLFPAFLATEIIMGLLATSLVPRIGAMEERIEAHVAEKLTMTETAADRQFKLTGEGTQIPKTKISKAEGNVRLYKLARMLEYSYEAARLQRLDVIGAFLQRMGEQMGIDGTDNLIDNLIVGDGTSGSAVVDTDAEVTGTFDYDEIIRLRQAFPLGYRMTNAITTDAQIRTILNMAEFKDPQSGAVRFQDGGLTDEFPLVGATWHRWTSTGSSAYSTDRILAVDNRRAIKVLTEGDFLEESDKLIDKQLHQRTMSIWQGYMKLDNSATQCLDIN